MDQKTEGSATGAISGEALKPCPFCGSGAEITRDDPAPIFCWVQCKGYKANTGFFDGTEEAEAVAAWNRRSDERTEFAEIIVRLKQRGLIPETFDAATLEVAHA